MIFSHTGFIIVCSNIHREDCKARIISAAVIFSSISVLSFACIQSNLLVATNPPAAFLALAAWRKFSRVKLPDTTCSTSLSISTAFFPATLAQRLRLSGDTSISSIFGTVRPCSAALAAYSA